MSNVLSEKTVVIRKSRKCHGCFKDFPPGTRMHKSVFVDGGLATWYLCSVCRKVMEKASEDMTDGDRFSPGFSRDEERDLYEKFLKEDRA